MKDARALVPANATEAWLRDFDLRDLNAADPRSMWALKYRSRLARVLVALDGLPAGSVVLEVGCSQANGSLLAAERGLWALALDRDPAALGYAWRKHERGAFAPLCGLAETLPLAARSCDAVLAAEILEHLPDPPAALREMWRVLRPGGRLVVTTPNADFVHERLPHYGQRPPASAARPEGDAGGHLFAFSLGELRAVVAAAGFAVQTAGYEGTIVMSERLRLSRLLTPGATTTLSRLLNRLPGGRLISYTCVVLAARGGAPG